MRFLLFLLLALLLSACSSFSLPESFPGVRAERQYIHALDAYFETKEISLLQQFKRDYPVEPWSSRVDKVLLHIRELENRKRQIAELQQARQRQAQEVARLQAANQRLTEQVRELTEKLEQLKGVLIDVETQGQ